MNNLVEKPEKQKVYTTLEIADFSLEDMARAYRRGKNKGARDKAIQNVGFYQKQMQDIYDKKNKKGSEKL